VDETKRKKIHNDGERKRQQKYAPSGGKTHFVPVIWPRSSSS